MKKSDQYYSRFWVFGGFRSAFMPGSANAVCRVVVTLFALAWIAEGALSEQSPKLTPQTSVSAAVVVVLGKPVWFTNIRKERLVRCSVSITNNSDRSYWIQSRGTNEFVHNYESRREERAPWELHTYFCATGTSPYEIRPGGAFVTRKVFTLHQDVGTDVRLRVPLASVPPRGRPIIPRQHQVEVVSNIVHIPEDPLNGPTGSGGHSQPIRSETLLSRVPAKIRLCEKNARSVILDR